MELPLRTLGEFVAGVAAHLLYFNRGEHHLLAARYVQIFTATFLATAAVLVWRPSGADGLGQPWSSALVTSAKIHATFLAGLYTSLSVYRLFFHPLRNFPGPIGARLGALWLSYDVRHGDGYKRVTALHERYGPFVRIGPAELSITHPSAPLLIYGHGSKCKKGPNYDLTRPIVSLQTFREKAEHDRRRRVWSAGFSDSALRGYERRIKTYRDKLIANLVATDGAPTDMTKWFNWYSFDVMGDLAFGESFSMLDTASNHWAIELLNEGVAPLMLMLPMWLFRLAVSIPGLANKWWEFIGFCKDRLLERMKTTPSIPDIMSTLLVPLKGQKPDKEQLNLLIGDAQLIIAAGSDTTATTLTAVFYFLAKNPECIAKIRKELEPILHDKPEDYDIPSEKSAHLDYINGVINEALRLLPPVPTAIYRNTPPEGLYVDDKFIPGNMGVYSPQYTIGRTESIFPSPDEFIPERWFSSPEMVKDKSAFIPFSAGPYGCIGKNLALMNLRATIARIVWTFDLKPEAGFERFEDEPIDHFLLSFGKLPLSLKRRSA